MVVAARTVSQIAVHMSVSFALMYAFTGSLAFGGLAAILEPVCTVLVMPFHDRFWERVERSVTAREAGRGNGAAADATLTQPA